MRNFLTMRLSAPLALTLNDREVTIGSIAFVPKRVHKYDPREEQLAVIGKIAVYLVHDLSAGQRIIITF